MKTINLKKYYYHLFPMDTFIEVTDEVAEALLLMEREENNRRRKLYYHKAYYSLDREDGIETYAIDFVEKSPEEIMLEQEEERLFLVTLEMLYQYAAPTKEKTLAGLKEIIPVWEKKDDLLAKMIVENTVRKLEKLAEPECSRFIADNRVAFIEKRDTSGRKTRRPPKWRQRGLFPQTGTENRWIG